MFRPLLLTAVAAACLLAGCDTVSESLNKRPPVDITQPTQPVRPAPIAALPPANGSIFQASQYRPLFEDYRARLVGDVINVQIVEKISATQTSTSSIDKSGTLGAGITAIPFVKPNSFTNGRANIGLNSANTFAGKGSTESSNDFAGTITATVTEVLPNGHLMIAGEKQIGVNHNVDVLRFSGQVDPHQILSGNTVPSSQIANVRIEQSGRGQQAEAQGIGWLGRFFLNVLPI